MHSTGIAMITFADTALALHHDGADYGVGRGLPHGLSS
jgi:hypothetical protein